ncbi:MAG TPA: oligoendopeptidase F [Ruminococcaceae bacterium]|nr:oligoendopeptidase F [Oscillospiraceae bacterium]
MGEPAKIKTRDGISPNDKWAVEKIYKNTDEWNTDFSKLKENAAGIPAFRGKLSDAHKLLEFFKLDEKVSRRAEKLFVYANLRSDEDTSNSEFLGLKSKISVYLSELEAAESFFMPEILSYPEGTVENEIKALPDLELYRFRLEQILRLKSHTLDKNSESILASLSDCLEAPHSAYTLLSNADMEFHPVHDENGMEVPLTESSYYGYITSKDRRVRREAFQSLFGGYRQFRNTFASLLVSSVKRCAMNAKLRHYKSSLESSLFPNGIPLGVYSTAADVVDKNLNLLHRYVNIKKKLLGIDTIHMYDLYAPLVDVPDVHIEFSKAVDIVKEGLAPLGKEYIGLFSKGISEGWVDRYPNKGKRSGAYSWGCYDTQPYVLMNYNYTLDDVSTLAHEMGHSLHSYYSKKTQPYIYSDYAIFCAEVASTTNESLLIRHLIANEQDKNKKLYLVNSQLEQIRATVFRQMMFAEFETFTHEQTEKGIPLTADDLCSYWHKLNVRYYGPEMMVDPEIDIEWARIPHFYRDFYVYQYATGYAAANSFAEKILSDGEKAVEQYKGFLKSGSSDYPVNILRKAGVDMATAKPMQDTMATFSRLLDMLESGV